MKATRGDEALRRFRVSQPGADYFLTMNLAEKGCAEFATSAKEAIRSEIGAIEHSAHWRIRGAVIMPDHLHLLVTLGPTLVLSRVVARLKSRTRAINVASGASWQSNYYEHRLRPNDDAGDVLLYIFLNPYRANLISRAEGYPWFWLGKAEQEWFNPGLENDRPPAEWLR